MTSNHPTVASAGESQSVMTRQQMQDFIKRRRDAYEDLDASALAADYAENAIIESPTAGIHTGPDAAERAFRVIFNAFLDLTTKMWNNPQKVMEAQVALWTDYMELWRATALRMVGSPAMERARDWGLAKLKALGFENIKVEAFTTPTWSRGAESAEVVGPWPHRLARTSAQSPLRPR